jgi:hypothetical protein
MDYLRGVDQRLGQEVPPPVVAELVENNKPELRSAEFLQESAGQEEPGPKDPIQRRGIDRIGKDDIDASHSELSRDFGDHGGWLGAVVGRRWPETRSELDMSPDPRDDEGAHPDDPNAGRYADR